jgi:hypothetical protein
MLITKSKSKADSHPLYLSMYVVLLVLFSFVLAGVSTGFSNFTGWISFLAILLLAAGLFWITGQIIKRENPPRWLLYLTISAALLRLAMGVTWFVGLPAGGYETEVQQAGYVMEDAYNRDLAAWDLAKSQQPLAISFLGFSSTDQYGGLLFLSATIYRYLSVDVHYPLLIVVLTAAVSALAVAFTWAFARRGWGDRVAVLAAWGLAIYPEAVLLGSSQMREAFTICLVPLAIYGLFRFREQMGLANGILLAAPIALSIPLTWAFTPSLILILILVYLSLDGWEVLKSTKTWIIIAAAIFVIVVALLFFVNIEGLWLVQSAKWQAYVSANASGWVAREFERLPDYGQVPFLVIYGIFRPILPAALIDTGPVIWTAIGIWRSLGWTILLAMLVYATYLVFRNRVWARLPGVLFLSSWLVSFTSSYRGGGDLWDNPRYRSAFAAVQIALAAWAWVRYRETSDPWLRRAIVGVFLFIVWFVPWYLRRYTAISWPISELYQVIGLGMVSTTLYVFWDWMRQE